jgi:hypothetical protein
MLCTFTCITFIYQLILWLDKYPVNCGNKIFVWNRLQPAGNHTKDGEVKKTETNYFYTHTAPLDAINPIHCYKTFCSETNLQKYVENHIFNNTTWWEIVPKYIPGRFEKFSFPLLLKTIFSLSEFSFKPKRPPKFCPYGTASFYLFLNHRFMFLA